MTQTAFLLAIRKELRSCTKWEVFIGRNKV